MKNVYLLTLLIFSFALAGTVSAAQSGDAPGDQHQKQYVETGLTGDGIENSYQDPDGIGDDDDDDGNQNGTTTEDQLRAQERVHAEDVAGDQPKEQVQEQVQTQEQLHTEAKDMASTLAEMKRLLEQIRNAFAKLYGWN